MWGGTRKDKKAVRRFTGLKYSFMKSFSAERLLRGLYKDRFRGRPKILLGNKTLDKLKWKSVLDELKGMDFINFTVKGSELDWQFDVYAKVKGIEYVQRQIEYEQRKRQSILMIVLTFLIVLLTALNIWLSIKREYPKITQQKELSASK